MRGNDPYNPLDKQHLGESVAQRLMLEPEHALPLDHRFAGAGVYALFYHGNHPAYRLLTRAAEANIDVPIYVGKAVPEGARKGGFGLGVSPGFVLHGRIREHGVTIQQTGLDIQDFGVRFLLVDDIWIPLGESMLISRYQPVWNFVLDGFGNHDPGKGRYNQQKSAWDVLHPGRPWANLLPPNPFPPAEWQKRCIAHVKERVRLLEQEG
jgi:hypothetical protein